MSTDATWTIVNPISPRPEKVATSERLRVNRPIDGLNVGLEIDYAWISYSTIIDEWETLLKADGAIPHTIWVERSREDTRTERTEAELRADIEAWSQEVDCAFVGLGN